MRDAGCGMRALRIPHPALVKVAECGLRNQARLPFSASVILLVFAAAVPYTCMHLVRMLVKNRIISVYESC